MLLCSSIHAFKNFNRWHSGAAVFLFLFGFAAGSAIASYLFLGSRSSQPVKENASVTQHADRWKHQHPLPPL